MSKKLEEMTFEELAEHAARQVHSALLKDGGDGLRGEVHLWMSQAIHWSDLQQDRRRVMRKRK